jgi:DNA helicase-2/ATP-dependent DNA helicase PcrA
LPEESSLLDPIVRDEIDQLRRVRTLLEEEPYILPPREADVVAELVRLREEIPQAKEEDKPALLQQYDHQHALLEQLRESRAAAQVDPDSPYFAHLRVREDEQTRDVFLGRATRIARGIRIVDWRHAPISRLFYAYQQGEEYEEELGDHLHAGEVLARRTVTIRRGELERIDAPEGTFFAEEAGWRKADREAPRLAGEKGRRCARTGWAGRPSAGSGPIRAGRAIAPTSTSPTSPR